MSPRERGATSAGEEEEEEDGEGADKMRELREVLAKVWPDECREKVGSVCKRVSGRCAWFLSLCHP